MAIKECVDHLIAAIQECPEYAAYHEALDRVKKYPEKMARLQEFRQKNYRIQNSDAEIDLFAESDRVADEFRDVYQDAILQNYLKAEAGLCKVIQSINVSVVGCLDFEPLDDNAT